MRHKNFLVGIVVGAMLVGASFIVGTVDAAPRMPGQSPPPPRGTEKRIPGPKKKEIPKQPEKKPDFVVECPATVKVDTGHRIDVPSGWIRGHNLVTATFVKGETGKVGAIMGVAPDPEQRFLRCTYRASGCTHEHQMVRNVVAQACTLSADTKSMDCYK